VRGAPPTTADSSNLLRATTAATRSARCLRGATPRAAPCGGLLLRTTATGATGFFRFCHTFLSRDYGSNAAAKRNCPLDPGSFRIELTNADVLVGGVHLPRPVAVRFRPRLRFVCRPPVATSEEQRLHGRRFLSFLDRRRERPSANNTLFAKIGQSIVIKAHVTVQQQASQ
jgi:hypothetical protein